ncbi:enoyl-CoA hydratase [Hyphomicrobium methylovorum]|uniref:enoyl-CoA hydratase-related protein n=1 Tax=Hyphomicrobium methylovorum TaxID=84 RepID=UPI0015E7CE19|nr:enoyl-CoA hydratase-related protein [Hyphomicrobium methylovorum]MBA2127294.1 enoyl-CoA hydratase [Hyphomicrobium methylovorum]
MSEAVTISRNGAVQIVRLTRAEKKNAISSEMYRALADAIEAGERDEAVGAHILAGSGGIFTAGNDLGDFLASARGNGDLSSDVLRFIRLLPDIRKPMVAAVDGAAIGIGTTLLFHCDLVYCTPESSFATPFLDLGLVPEAASSLLMPMRMGYARAFEMLVLGDTFSPVRAVAAGMVNAIVAKDALDATALAAAARLAAKPRAALTAARDLMRSDAREIRARIDAEVVAFRDLLSSPDAIAALDRFFATRGKGTAN